MKDLVPDDLLGHATTAHGLRHGEQHLNLGLCDVTGNEVSEMFEQLLQRLFRRRVGHGHGQSQGVGNFVTGHSGVGQSLLQVNNLGKNFWRSAGSCHHLKK